VSGSSAECGWRKVLQSWVKPTLPKLVSPLSHLTQAISKSTPKKSLFKPHKYLLVAKNKEEDEVWFARDTCRILLKTILGTQCCRPPEVTTEG
jgi:hypothetical protein